MASNKLNNAGQQQQYVDRNGDDTETTKKLSDTDETWIRLCRSLTALVESVPGGVIPLSAMENEYLECNHRPLQLYGHNTVAELLVNTGTLAVVTKAIAESEGLRQKAQLASCPYEMADDDLVVVALPNEATAHLRKLVDNQKTTKIIDNQRIDVTVKKCGGIVHGSEQWSKEQIEHEANAMAERLKNLDERCPL